MSRIDNVVFIEVWIRPAEGSRHNKLGIVCQLRVPVGSIVVNLDAINRPVVERENPDVTRYRTRKIRSCVVIATDVVADNGIRCGAALPAKYGYAIPSIVVRIVVFDGVICIPVIDVKPAAIIGPCVGVVTLIVPHFNIRAVVLPQ